MHQLINRSDYRKINPQIKAKQNLMICEIKDKIKFLDDEINALHQNLAKSMLKGSKTCI